MPACAPGAQETEIGGLRVGSWSELYRETLAQDTRTKQKEGKKKNLKQINNETKEPNQSNNHGNNSNFNVIRRQEKNKCCFYLPYSGRALNY